MLRLNFYCTWHLYKREAENKTTDNISGKSVQIDLSLTAMPMTPSPKREGRGNELTIFSAEDFFKDDQTENNEQKDIHRNKHQFTPGIFWKNQLRKKESKDQ